MSAVSSLSKSRTHSSPPSLPSTPPPPRSTTSRLSSHSAVPFRHRPPSGLNIPTPKTVTSMPPFRSPDPVFSDESDFSDKELDAEAVRRHKDVFRAERCSLSRMWGINHCPLLKQANLKLPRRALSRSSLMLQESRETLMYLMPFPNTPCKLPLQLMAVASENVVAMQSSHSPLLIASFKLFSRMAPQRTTKWNFKLYCWQFARRLRRR
jgi:hypothetical protein